MNILVEPPDPKQVPPESSESQFLRTTVEALSIRLTLASLHETV